MVSEPEASIVHEAPFKAGDRVGSRELATWQYVGLSGKPGKDRHAVRRFTKGGWSLEVYAHADHSRSTRVISIRTLEEDATYWRETRQRLMRHRE